MGKPLGAEVVGDGRYGDSLIAVEQEQGADGFGAVVVQEVVIPVSLD
jgi:hypothetical protein